MRREGAYNRRNFLHGPGRGRADTIVPGGPQGAFLDEVENVPNHKHGAQRFAVVLGDADEPGDAIVKLRVVGIRYPSR